jgi:hypothetical protein
VEQDCKVSERLISKIDACQMRGGGCPSWETSIVAPCLPQLPSVILTTQKIHQIPFTFVKTSISLCAEGLTDSLHDSHLTNSSSSWLTLSDIGFTSGIN